MLRERVCVPLMFLFSLIYYYTHQLSSLKQLVELGWRM